MADRTRRMDLLRWIDDSEPHPNSMCGRAAAEIRAMQEEIERLREALQRARDWGVGGKAYDSGEALRLADWIDAGCIPDDLPPVETPFARTTLQSDSPS